MWRLSKDGDLAGHLVSRVDAMRALPAFWVRREWLLYAIVWRDDVPELRLEDYGPDWYTVAELEQGFYEDDDRGGRFEAARVLGSERDELWSRWSDLI